jgi:hypothetical protein
MTSPIFPGRSTAREEGTKSVFVIEPYRHEGAWVFDAPEVGLAREPFVSGVTEMIDRLVAEIPDANGGFRLLFATFPFGGSQTTLSLVRTDPVEGYWYRADDTGDEGWLCPALLCYFRSAPKQLFVRAEAVGGSKCDLSE